MEIVGIKMFKSKSRSNWSWKMGIHTKKNSKNSNLLFSANSKANYNSKLKSVDWVFIATPDKTHFQIAKKIIKKINIFVKNHLL